MTKQHRINSGLFLILSFFGMILFTNNSVQAQTTEQLHQKSEVSNEWHAKGKAPKATLNPVTFAKRYAPPKSLSSLGDHFDWLFRYISWVTFAFFLIIIALLVYFCIAYRERDGHSAYYTTGTKEKKLLVLCDIFFFIILDVVLIYWSVVDTRRFMMSPPTGPEVVRVQVMPQQWVWNFRYPGQDDRFGTPDDIVTVNELWLPKGKMASFQIKSKDVIHGFMFPHARRQVDAIPGSVTRIWFDVNQNGDYEIACMHLCGTAHYKMKAFLKVVDGNHFENWKSEMSEWSQEVYDAENKLTHWGWNWGLN